MCTVLYCAVLCCTVLYCTVLYYCHRVSTQLQLTNISYININCDVCRWTNKAAQQYETSGPSSGRPTTSAADARLLGCYSNLALYFCYQFRSINRIDSEQIFNVSETSCSGVLQCIDCIISRWWTQSKSPKLRAVSNSHAGGRLETSVASSCHNILTHYRGREGSFKLFKRPFPGFLTILTL